MAKQLTVATPEQVMGLFVQATPVHLATHSEAIQSIRTYEHGDGSVTVFVTYNRGPKYVAWRVSKLTWIDVREALFTPGVSVKKTIDAKLFKQDAPWDWGQVEQKVQ